MKRIERISMWTHCRARHFVEGGARTRDDWVEKRMFRKSLPIATFGIVLLATKFVSQRHEVIDTT